MNHLIIWRITLRRMALVAKERTEFSFEIAIPRGGGQREALDFAKKYIHSPEWWECYLVIGVEEAGELWAVDPHYVPPYFKAPDPELPTMHFPSKECNQDRCMTCWISRKMREEEKLAK